MSNSQSRKKIYPSESNLPAIKSIARSILMLDIQPTEFSPIVVKHPFTDSGIVGLRYENGSPNMVNLLYDPEALRKWTEDWKEQIDKAETAFELMLMITKPYKLGFLKYAAPGLSEQDLAHFLSHAWVATESPGSDPNLSQRKLLSMFRSVDPKLLMSDEEYAVFHSLDDVVTVYRGVTSHNAQNIRAMSWTLDRDTAGWFAYRYGEKGTVYEAQIKKEHICAVFTGRNESEVIVDPKHLMELSPVPEQTNSFEMTM